MDIDELAEQIEEYMKTVPGQDDRPWNSVDMATKLATFLRAKRCVRLSDNQEIPDIKENISRLALDLIKAGAEPFTAGAGAMWEALQQEGFRRVELILLEGE